MFKKLTQFVVINLEVNTWNGFVFELFQVEYAGEDYALLGLWIDSESISIDLLFFNLTIEKPKQTGI